MPQKINLSIYLFLVIIYSLMPLTSNGEIYLANSIAEINNSILASLQKRGAEKSVLLLPLERFLARPVNEEFFATDEKYQHIIKEAEAKAKPNRKAYFSELTLTSYKNQLADKAIIPFIKTMQEQRLPIIAYTNNVSGKFNQIDYLEVWTWSYLLSQQIDLSKNPIGQQQFIFNQYHHKILGSYPTYYKGLLSANEHDRKNSLQSVLATLFAIKLKSIPDVIYIIHHDAGFLKSITEQFQNLRRDVQVEAFIFEADRPVNNKLPVADLYKFWLDLVTKLNNVTR